MARNRWWRSRGGRIEVGEPAIRDGAGGYRAGTRRGGAGEEATRRFWSGVCGVGGVAERFEQPGGGAHGEARRDREAGCAAGREPHREEFSVCDSGQSADAPFAGDSTDLRRRDPAAAGGGGS